MSANSSSTSDVPMPTKTAATLDQRVSVSVATAVSAPMTSRMMPGTA